MIKIKNIFLAALFLFLSLTTHCAMANSYIGFQAGVFTITFYRPFYSYMYEYDYMGGVFRFNYGNLWQIEDKLDVGFETGVNHFRSERINAYDSSIFYKRTSVDLLAMLNYRIFTKSEIFAKLGPSYAYEKDLSYWSFTHNGITGKGVLGIGYNITKKINLNFSYNSEFARHHLKNINTLNTGINFNF